MKLINVDEAINRLEDLNVASFYEENEHSREAYHEIKWMLENMPIVDAVPVRHGRWVADPEDDGVCSCSECGRYEFYESDFCPNCGVRMEAKNAVN